MIFWRRRVRENGGMKAKDVIIKTQREWNNVEHRFNNTDENEEKSESCEDIFISVKIMHLVFQNFSK